MSYWLNRFRGLKYCGNCSGPYSPKRRSRLPPYEILALTVFIPWALATFGDPPRGLLHWLPGLIGGLSIVLNWAFIIYGALELGRPDRADLAGQPGPGAVCPACGADGRRRPGRRFLVPDPLSGLGTHAWFQTG